MELKKLVYPLAFTVALLSCDDNSNNYSPEEIKVKNSIEALNKKQLQQIQYIHAAFAEVYHVSLEQTIINFGKESNPQKEIELWMKMAKTYEKFALIHPDEEALEKRSEAFKMLLFRSLMTEHDVLKNFDFKALDITEVKQILKDFTNTGISS